MPSRLSGCKQASNFDRHVEGHGSWHQTLVTSIHAQYARPLTEGDRPDRVMAIYPGHLAVDRNLATDNDARNPNVPVSRETPPTFSVQAVDEHVDGVKQSLAY